MSLSARWAVRAICALGTAAIALVAFGSFGARPELGPATSFEDAVPDALAFVVPEAAEVRSDLEAPELLGLDAARAAAAQSDEVGFAPERLGPIAANAVIAAEIREEALGIPAAGSTRPESVDGSVASTDPAPEIPVVTTAGSATDSTAGDAEEAAGTATADTADLPADDLVVGEAAPVREPWALPPPPASSATLPRYDNPSAALVAASGRPFPVVAEVAADAVRGVSGDEIRVGGLVSRTLAGFPHRADVCQGAQARFDQANAHGELTRRITFDPCFDDEGRVDLAAKLAATFAIDDVFAVVPLSSDAFFADDILTTAQIPYVGTGDLPAFCGRGTPLGYGVQGSAGCPVLEARGYTALAEPVLSALASTWSSPMPDAIAYLVEGGARGDAVKASRTFEAELLGWPAPNFFSTIPTPAQGPVTRWATRVDAVLATDPQVVIIEARGVHGLPEALRDAGFEGEVVLVGRVDPLDIADPDARQALAPMTVVSLGLDVASRTSDGWHAIAGAAAVSGVGPDQMSLDFLEGYMAADFFVRAVAATPEPLTAAAVANTVNAGWWYSGIDGVSCGSWWPAGHLIGSPCVSIARVDLLSPSLVPVLGLVETAPLLQFGLG